MTDPLLVLAIAVVAFFAGACLSYAFLDWSHVRDHRRR